MTLLSIEWASVGSKVVQLILALSILVISHEFGHYITARWFKCRVEKFYLFFDPWFSIVKKKVGETVYGIGWLPLGGYVKIAGMVDESMDKETMKQPPQPWEFRSKPAWQRLIIMLAGVTVNILLAFFIYAMILFTWGEKKVVNNSFQYGIYCSDSLLLNNGLQNGDKILAVNGKEVLYFEDVPGKLITADDVTVERNGKKEEIKFREDFMGELRKLNKRGVGFIDFRKLSLVGDMSAKDYDTSYAKKAGLMANDKIIAVDSVPVTFMDEVGVILEKKKNGTALFEVERNGEHKFLTSKVNSDGKVLLPWLADYDSLAARGMIKVDTKKYSFLASFPAGVRKTGEKLGAYVDQFKKILNPKTGGYKVIGGFGSIGSVFPTPWDWQAFWSITAFLSVILAFMNLLPIPALDGGHVLFTLGEMITGRKPSQKFLEYAQVIGMILLLALMLFANGNDIFRWFKGK